MVTARVIGESATSLGYQVTFDPRDFRASRDHLKLPVLPRRMHPVLRLMPVVAAWNNVYHDHATCIDSDHMPLRFHEAKLGHFEVVLSRSVIW